MRRNRFFSAVKYARNDPRTDRTPPHEISLSPCCNAQYANGCCVLHGRDGDWGCNKGLSMVQLYASRRSLRVVALALCSAAIVSSATPASARPPPPAAPHPPPPHPPP